MAKRILLVDDDENILFLFGLALEDGGYSVEKARCGKDALNLAQNMDFDLIILDYKLSDMKGDEIADRLNLKSNPVPILLVTGYREMSERFEKTPHPGISKVLLKPLTDDELLAEVDHVLM